MAAPSHHLSHSKLSPSRRPRIVTMSSPSPCQLGSTTPVTLLLAPFLFSHGTPPYHPVFFCSAAPPRAPTTPQHHFVSPPFLAVSAYRPVAHCLRSSSPALNCLPAIIAEGECVVSSPFLCSCPFSSSGFGFCSSGVQPKTHVQCAVSRGRASTLHAALLMAAPPQSVSAACCCPPFSDARFRLFPFIIILHHLCTGSTPSAVALRFLMTTARPDGE
jgi:hypothetical protein